MTGNCSQPDKKVFSTTPFHSRKLFAIFHFVKLKEDGSGKMHLAVTAQK